MPIGNELFGSPKLKETDDIFQTPARRRYPSILNEDLGECIAVGFPPESGFIWPNGIIFHQHGFP